MASVTLQAPIATPEQPDEGQHVLPSAAGRVPAHVILATLLAVAGVLSVWPTALLLWSLWTTDPLKSIGGFVPLVSAGLILRTWRAGGWRMAGSWWGLVVLGLTILIVKLRDGAVLELVLTPSWTITLPPHSLVAFGYVSGVVLLLGGTAFWRAARFPICLMLLVNPVPHAFSRLIDLPLQHASAAVARGLAHFLGQRLTPDQLYLMFTPDFGMFIAPGCNGIRGSVTMGLIALVAGYLYRLRLRVWASLVAGAVLLGYLFNLLRLCALVLYYVVALHWHWLQGHAEMGDYCIGATLFFFAAMLLFSAIRRFSPEHSLQMPPVATWEQQSVAVRVLWPKLTGLALVLAAGAAPYTVGMLRTSGRGKTLEASSVHFPQTIGSYALRRTWPEKLDTGQTIFEWAEYALPGATTAISIGVSPVLGAHDTLLCHAARGEDWLWHGTLVLPTSRELVSFSATLFNDGSVQYMEASTVCAGAACGQWSTARTHFGLIYSRPDSRSLERGEVSRPVPILLRAETTDALLPADAARVLLAGELQSFSRNASFGAFAKPVNRP